jgi:hypothetical protein
MAGKATMRWTNRPTFRHVISFGNQRRRER